MHNLPVGEVGDDFYESYGSAGVYVVRYASLVLPCYVSVLSSPRVVSI
jgi:hypothetical protein